MRRGGSNWPFQGGVGHGCGGNAVFGFGGAAAVRYPAARVMEHRTPFATKDGFTFLEGAVAEWAKALDAQMGKPRGVLSIEPRNWFINTQRRKDLESYSAAAIKGSTSARAGSED
jgi:hypothetical protein